MNTFGATFRMTSFGESHGTAVGAVIDGCPAGLKLDMAYIEEDLRRRRGGKGDGTTTRKEPDTVEWLSGLMDGVTTGAPIAFAISNKDVRNEDYENLQGLLRPGHGDYAWLAKHGIYDPRGGGRNSGRITAPWVVVGCIAKQVLERWNVSVRAESCTSGRVMCRADGVPAGWGAPSFSSLKAVMAQAAMSIPSATAFEMGLGKDAAAMTGEEYADAWEERLPFKTTTNHCGGVQGGLSCGMPLEFAVTFHMPVTHTGIMRCANATTGMVEEVEVKGRHDKDHTARLLPVVEAMAAIVLANFALEK
ncbi:MAG: chorismate synthase [Bacteroidales bacterium]|nr:chorismate synthase [Bacteroidales bacterium]